MLDYVSDGTSDELFEALVTLLDRAPGVAIVGYVSPGLADSDVRVEFVRNRAAPGEFDAAVLVAKQNLTDMGREFWFTAGTYDEQVTTCVSRLSGLGAFVFVCLVPWADRHEDVTVYWAAPSGGGELAESGTTQALLLLDAELGNVWLDETAEDRVGLFEPARLDPEALPL